MYIILSAPAILPAPRAPFERSTPASGTFRRTVASSTPYKFTARAPTSRVRPLSEAAFICAKLDLSVMFCGFNRKISPSQPACFRGVRHAGFDPPRRRKPAAASDLAQIGANLLANGPSHMGMV
ncbi:hypothetical protein KO516_03720 [Citreicella sp. C3M06]|uniref:hypothetical protein n=1 Tax=Citreicella sp. C3M06 TaxID=2841564 RepID=UPI001C09356E|nr:hypothetical protein [Citreicella sp. C3M06]MBU2959947.1 hypothetical protein [Citreicella sp. C3M06]